MNNVNNVNNALKSMAYTMNEARTKSEHHEHVYNQGLTEFCPGVFGGRGSNVVNEVGAVERGGLGGRSRNHARAIVDKADEVSIV